MAPCAADGGEAAAQQMEQTARGLPPRWEGDVCGPSRWRSPRVSLGNWGSGGPCGQRGLPITRPPAASEPSAPLVQSRPGPGCSRVPRRGRAGGPGSAPVRVQDREKCAPHTDDSEVIRPADQSEGRAATDGDVSPAGQGATREGRRARFPHGVGHARLGPAFLCACGSHSEPILLPGGSACPRTRAGPGAGRESTCGV